MSDVFQFLNFAEVSSQFVRFVPRIFAAALMLLFFWLFYLVTARSLRALLGKANVTPSIVHLLINNLYQVVIVIIGVLMAISQLGVNVTAALTGLGVVGIAIGLAAQDTLANIIGGVVILWDQPFLAGDFVTTAGQYGRVTNITLRTTRIRTQENTYVVIPNKSIIDSVLVNHTKHGEIRVNVPVGIAYKESISEARRVILEAVKPLPGILDEPSPEVVVEGLGDSSVNLQIRVWIRDAFQERPTQFRVVEAAKVALDNAGIQIPFPHLQLFVDDIEKRCIEKIATIPAFGAGPARG